MKQEFIYINSYIYIIGDIFVADDRTFSFYFQNKFQFHINHETENQLQRSTNLQPTGFKVAAANQTLNHHPLLYYIRFHFYCPVVYIRIQICRIFIFISLSPGSSGFLLNSNALSLRAYIDLVQQKKLVQLILDNRDYKS